MNYLAFKKHVTSVLLKTLGIFTYLFFSSTFMGFSQNTQTSFNFINYTIKDGLPSLETYDVFHDSKGYTWIATDNGVVKYDGNTFTPYTTKEGLTDNTIFRIKEDESGRIWFLTYNRKICYLENDVFIPYKFNDVIAEKTRGIHLGITISDISFTPEESIKLLLVNNTQLTITKDGNTNPNLTFSLTLFDHPNLSELKFAELVVPKTKDCPSFSKFIFRKSGNIKIQINIVDSVYYVSTTQDLMIWDPIENKIIRLLVHNKTITGVSKDFEGGIWLSTLNKGVFYIPNFELYKYALPAIKTPLIHALIKQKDDVVLCLKHHNYQINPDLRELDLALHPEKICISQMDPEKFKEGIKIENPIYIKGQVTTVTGLACYTMQHNIVSLDHIGLCFSNSDNSEFAESIPPGIRNQFLYTGDRSWKVYSGRKHYQDHNNTHNFTLIDNLQNRVLRIFIDKQRTIWVSTLNGVLQITPPLFKVTTPSLPNQLLHNRVQDISQTKDSTMLFGTQTDGVYFVNSDSIYNLDITDGLISNKVNTLIYDSINNFIYISSNLGITVLENKQEHWSVLKTISFHDGLDNSSISVMYLDQGFLYFSSSDALHKLPVTEISKRLPAPILYLTDLFVNQKLIESKDEIQLTHDQNNIEINYAGLSYKSEDDISFAYRLSPLQTEWRPTKNPNVAFNSLTPGEYIFEVKAINLEGKSSEIQSVRIAIIEAFWMTLWFKVLIVVLLGVLIYYMTNTVILYYKNQANIQEKLKELQIISLQSKMNPHFIFNSLNSIQNFILKNEKENANDYLTQFSRLVRKILQNSDTTSISLQNEMDTLKLYVELEQKRLRKPFKYTVNIDSEIDLENCLIPPLLFEPYVENAIWHGKVYDNIEGEVAISISVNSNVLFIQITDNGIGIQNAQKSKIRKSEHQSLGSEITRKRIQLLSELNTELSAIKIEPLFHNDMVFSGTKVSFSIPYLLKHT